MAAVPQDPADAPELLRVGVLGCGNVGGPLVELIAAQGDAIEARTGVRLDVTRVAVRDLSKPRPRRHRPGAAHRRRPRRGRRPRHRPRGRAHRRHRPRPGAHPRRPQGGQAGRHRQQGAARHRRRRALRGGRGRRRRPALRGRRGRRHPDHPAAARVARRGADHPGARASSTAPPTSSSPAWPSRGRPTRRRWPRPRRWATPRPTPPPTSRATTRGPRSPIIASIAFGAAVVADDVHHEGITAHHARRHRVRRLGSAT